MLVGFSGLAQAGKDTAGEALRSCGYTHLSFATELKKMALSLDPILEFEEHFLRLSTLHKWGGWECVKSRPWADPGGDNGGPDSRGVVPPGRKFLLDLGSEISRVFGEDWLAKTVDLSLPFAYVTDVRRESELQLIRSHGGINIFIKRPGLEPVSEHVLEDGRLEHMADFVVLNNGTIDRLHDRVLDCLGKFQEDHK